MANQLILDRALDANGYIAPGAKATIFADSTSTLITVYSDVAGTIAATNPIVADGDGFWPQRYVTENAKAVVTDADDVALYTLDPAPTAQGTGAAASAVSFSPTIALPQTNVQAAIEAAADLAISGVADFGLGITGNAPVLANIDATGTASGAYRWTGTTTGTFPAGISAATTGLVVLDRQTAAEAMQTLRALGQSRVYYRFLTSTTWGSWLESPTPLADPGADRLRFWDDSAGSEAYATLGTGLSITGTTINAATAGWERVETVYDSAVDGTQTSLETSDFEDGYSYRLVGLYLSGSGNAGMGAEFFRQTSAAYSSVTTIGGTTTLATNFTYTINRPMEAEFYHDWWGEAGVGFATTPANSQTVIASSPLAITHATAQKISKIRITRPSQNFTAGKLYLERQRVS